MEALAFRRARKTIKNARFSARRRRPDCLTTPALPLPQVLVIIIRLWRRRPVKEKYFQRLPRPMKFIAKIFAPTNNRRLNELIGFLLCVFALLLFLALASYSPLDPSLNSASVLDGSRTARNWIGIVGAIGSDLLLQGFGIGAFLLPVFAGLLGVRWFRSRKTISPVAKTLGGLWLIVFVPALLALLPGHVRWVHVIPIEGLLGRIVGDALIHYLNLAGAYIVCATVLGVALYLSTAFSFSSFRSGCLRASRLPSHFGSAIRIGKNNEPSGKCKRNSRSAAPLSPWWPRKRYPRLLLRPSYTPRRAEPVKSGIDRMLAPTVSEEQPGSGAPIPRSKSRNVRTPVKSKTTMPRIAGGYKLPSSSLLHRSDDQQVVDADELKLLAQVLVEKYAEFEVHGQVTQINPGPVVTTFEFKPEAGIKYSRITGLTDDLASR